MFFSLPSWAVAVVLFAIVGTATAVGYAAGYYLREHEAKVREPFGVLQAAILGVVGLILAFAFRWRSAATKTGAPRSSRRRTRSVRRTSVRSSLPSLSEADRWSCSAGTRPSRGRSQGGAEQFRNAADDRGRRRGPAAALGA